MNTLTDKTDEVAKSSKAEAFEFDGWGDCTNPRRVMIPMPPGIACAVLLAQKEIDGFWLAGFEVIGSKIGKAAEVVSTKSPSFETREQAIAAMLPAIEDYLRDCAPVCPEMGPALEACVAWRTKHLSAAAPNLETTPPAIGAKESDGAAGGSDAPGGGAAADSSSAPAQPPLPGVAHEFGEATGDAVSPEIVEVKGMPKKCSASIHLAQDKSGTWFSGFECKVDGAYFFEPANCGNAGYASREEALVGIATHELEVCFENLSDAKRKAVRAAIDALCAAEPEAAEPVVAWTPVLKHYRTSFADIAIAKIQRNPANHRKYFDSVKLRELADSILAEGLHQPIAVRRLLAGEQPEGELALGDPGAAEYELIYGERRWRAAQIAQLQVVTAKVYEDLPRERAHAIALIENLQRADINCMEEAEGYAALMAAENLTQEQCAERIGKARSTIANCLRLLKLPEQIRALLSEGKLTLAHGVALARFADWPKHLEIMAEEVVRHKEPAGAIERGVPHAYTLCHAGIAVRISQWGEYKVTDKLKKHSAYFSDGDGDWICFEPQHWAAEVQARDAAKKEREEKERAKREAEIAAAAKKGKKQLQLADLNRDDYRELDDNTSLLSELVPDDKRAIAKGHDGKRVTIVTDVQLADRLKNAMMRAIKKNRRGATAALEEKARKKIAGLKKVGPREISWLVYLITTYEGRRAFLNLDADAAKLAGVKLPKALTKDDAGDNCDEEPRSTDMRLESMSSMEPVDLVRVLMAERLPSALTDLVESGPDSTGARFIKWWLDSDTLWLLEETEDGRAELVEQVKNAPWYAKALAGESTEEGEE